jgi:hypothetical protein
LDASETLSEPSVVFFASVIFFPPQHSFGFEHETKDTCNGSNFVYLSIFFFFFFFSAMHKTPAPEDERVANVTQNDERAASGSGSKFNKKFWTRFVTTWIMIFGFFFMVRCVGGENFSLFFFLDQMYIGHLALAIVVSMVGLLMFSEIVNHGVEKRNEREVPGMKVFHWCCFVFLLISSVFLCQVLVHDIRFLSLRQNLRPPTRSRARP